MTLEQLLQRLIWLLKECDIPDAEIGWWVKRLADLKSKPDQAKKEIRENLGGMGTFSDLSLVPGAGSKLTRKNASDLQMELVEKIGRQTGS